jgi:hypothetical protein
LGLVVPIPIFPPALSNIAELPIALGLVHFGIWPVVPVPVTPCARASPGRLNAKLNATATAAPSAIRLMSDLLLSFIV